MAIGGFIFFRIGMAYRKKVAEGKINSAEEEAIRIVNEALKTAESKKKESLVGTPVLGVKNIPSSCSPTFLLCSIS